MTVRIAAQEAFKLALSMTLFLWLAIWMNWPNTSDGAMAIALINLATTGASLHKGILRVTGLGMGAAFGLLLVAAFPQERWLFLIETCLYLVFVSYFLQISKNRYAWMMLAMGALFTWVASYQHATAAFGPAFDKFSVTASGVIIYTLVSIVFWPKRAGGDLRDHGRTYLSDLMATLAAARDPGGDAQPLANKLDGQLRIIETNIGDATLDSPEVALRKEAWHRIGADLRALTDALQFWLPSLRLATSLDLERHIPQLDEHLDRIHQRLEECKALWGTDAQVLDDSEEPGPSTSSAVDLEALTIPDRARIMNLIDHLEALDAASFRLHASLGSLRATKQDGSGTRSAECEDRNKPVLWDPERLVNALFPSAGFLAGFLFWIYVPNSPGGPALPMLAGVLSVAVLMAPVKLMGLLIYMLISAVAILPIYLWVMPTLPQGGGSILGLVFVYTFGVAMLGLKSPALRFGPLLMFFTVAGIKNHQTYSFMGFVSLASMLLIAGSIVTAVHSLVHTSRPESVLRRSVRRFFVGCSSILDTYGASGHSDQRRVSLLRKRYYDSMIQAAPAQAGIAAKGLDYDQLEGCTPEQVQALVQGMQSVALRLRALEFGVQDISHLSPRLEVSFESLSNRLRSHAANLLRIWQDSGRGQDSEREMAELRKALEDLEHEIDQPENEDREDAGRRTTSLARAYSMLGNIQLLLESLTSTRNALDEIDWKQMALARF